jgi:uncharacterized protein (TIGR02186 family)
MTLAVSAELWPAGRGVGPQVPQMVRRSASELPSPTKNRVRDELRTTVPASRLFTPLPPPRQGEEAPSLARGEGGRAYALAFFFTVATITPATAETLVTTLSTERVAITSTYTGTEISVFGVIERDAMTGTRVRDYDLVVSARGPRRTTIVRQKEEVGPIWINRTQRRFIKLPVFLTVLATRPLEDIADQRVRQRLRLGVDAVLTPVGLEIDFDSPESRFREALLRLKTADGLYAENAKGITFLAPNVFTGTIPLPATAPVGVYDVEVALFHDGLQLARHTLTFEVIKTGFEQAVVDSSRRHAWLYGLATGALALVFGWFASVIFRRD